MQHEEVEKGLTRAEQCGLVDQNKGSQTVKVVKGGMGTQRVRQWTVCEVYLIHKN